MKKYFVLGMMLASLGLAHIASATVIDPPPAEEFPTSASQCKNGGWQNYNGIFKNQGDCVSFVATAGRNAPANL